MSISTLSRYVLPFFLGVIMASCNKPARQGDERMVKTECLSAVDERSYAEMTEYTVLKDVKKLDIMRSTRKIFPLKAKRKVKILKRKIDIALIEYHTGKGKRQVWVAVKNLQ